MKRKIALFVAATAVVSCGLQVSGDGSGDGTEDGADDVWTGPGSSIVNGDTGPIKKSVWFMTGFDYPEGYDWRSDQQVGEVKCSLVVFANGVPMMKVPVGHEYEVSSDPDMHRMIGSDLYTDYSDDSLTVIKKNGKLLYRYPGREMIVGMYVQDEDVYTLGQSRSGRGFSYRKNGEPVVERMNGTLFNTFFKTGQGCAFAFYETIKSESEDLERYFICIDGEVSQVAVREDVSKVWDILYKDGRIWYIATMVGVKWPVLVSDGEIRTLEATKNTSMRSCRFIPEASGITVEGVTQTLSTHVITGGIWRDGILEIRFPAGEVSVYSCAWEGGLCCALQGYKSGLNSIFRTGEIHPVPEGYAIMGTSPMAVVDGILHVALTAKDGAGPQVWKDGEMYPVKLNGYISSITVQ